MLYSKISSSNNAITENQLDLFGSKCAVIKPYGGYKSTKEFFDMPEFDGLALSGSIRESLSTQSNYYEIDVKLLMDRTLTI